MTSCCLFFQGICGYITTILSSLEFVKEFGLLTYIEGLVFFIIIFSSIILVLIAYRGIKILTDLLGDYQKRDPSKESKLKRVLKMTILYLISTFPAYIAVLSIISLPDNPQPFQISVIFPLSISLMISMRISTNPTAPVYLCFYLKKPEDVSFLDKIELKEVYDYVKSFYFSLILAGIIVIIADFLIGSKKLSDNFTILWNVPYLIPIMAIAYVVSLFILTYISEICILENGKIICL